MALRQGRISPAPGFVQLDSDEGKGYHHIVDTAMHPDLKDSVREDAPVLKSDTLLRKYVPVLENDCVVVPDGSEDEFCLFCHVDAHASNNVWYKKMKSYIENSISVVDIRVLCSNVVRLFDKHLRPCLPDEYRGRDMAAHTVERHLKSHSLNQTVILARKARTMNRVLQIIENSHLVYMGGQDDSELQVEFRNIATYLKINKELEATLKNIKVLSPSFGSL
jgi:hypothetical protein